MSETSYQTNKVSVLLAGAGHELVYYQMQPPLLSDARFIVAGHADDLRFHRRESHHCAQVSG